MKLQTVSDEQKSALDETNANESGNSPIDAEKKLDLKLQDLEEDLSQNIHYARV